MSSSGFTSSDLAKGRKFLNQLLYVQHVDKEKDTASEIPEQSLEEHLLTSRQMFADLNFTPYLKNPKANVGILKSFLTDTIILAKVYSNPLPIPLASKSNVTIHAFVVLTTWNDSDSKKRMWWSLEKNGKYIVLQQSPRKNDVTQKIYDAEKKEHVQRLGPVKELQSAIGNAMDIRNLLQAIWKTNQLSSPYHLLLSNCQNFASFVFAKSNYEGKKWSTVTSAIVDRFGLKNKKIQQPGIEADAVKYKSMVNDEKFKLYCAMIEGRANDFEELANDLTRESLNSVDSQGYTLLEWGTVFSTSDWPIDEFLKDKGAEMLSDEGSFRRNVFFIGLQYLPPDKKLLSFDGIDINGVNKTSDTALHLSLYGEKWEIAEKILHKFEDYDVNTTNIRGDTPLHLAAKLKHCEIGLFNKILDQTNLENVNKADGNGCTALHWAVRANSKGKMKFLLDRGIDINAQDNEGNTALHIAIMKELKTTVKFVKHEKVDVNVQNKDNRTALHLACKCWPNISAHTFQNILEKSTNINAQDKDGNTALHYAISEKSETGLQELLKHKDVDVNVKNNFNSTVLHYASRRQNLAVELFKLILEKSTDVNAQNEKGDTALHCAILNKSKIAIEELRKDDRVNVNVENKDGETAAYLLAL